MRTLPGRLRWGHLWHTVARDTPPCQRPEPSHHPITAQHRAVGHRLPAFLWSSWMPYMHDYPIPPPLSTPGAGATTAHGTTALHVASTRDRTDRKPKSTCAPVPRSAPPGASSAPAGSHAAPTALPARPAQRGSWGWTRAAVSVPGRKGEASGEAPLHVLTG